MALLQDPYPEVELIPPPLAQPLCEPRPLSPSRCSADECQPSTNRKRESYNMAGSTFLITASGITLRLPVPSNSKADPLNWGRWRRIGAIFAVGWYSAMASMVIQAASVVLPNIMEDFNEEVEALRSFLNVFAESDFATENQFVDDRDARHRSYSIHGHRLTSVATTIYRSGKTTCLPGGCIDDASCSSRCRSFGKLYTATCMYLYFRLRSRLLGHLCKYCVLPDDVPLTSKGFPDGHRHDFHTSASEGYCVSVVSPWVCRHRTLGSRAQYVLILGRYCLETVLLLLVDSYGDILRSSFSTVPGDILQAADSGF